MWNLSSSVQLDISLARCAHLQDIKLNTVRAIPYLQPLRMFYKLAKNDVFDDDDVSDHFPKILEKLSEEYRNVSEHFPKISQDSRRLQRKIRRCFDQTPTTFKARKTMIGI